MKVICGDAICMLPMYMIVSRIDIIYAQALAELNAILAELEGK